MREAQRGTTSNVKNVILPYKYVFIWHLVFGNRSMAEFQGKIQKIITTNSGFAYLHTPIWYLYLETVASGLTWSSQAARTARRV